MNRITGSLDKFNDVNSHQQKITIPNKIQYVCRGDKRIMKWITSCKTIKIQKSIILISTILVSTHP